MRYILFIIIVFAHVMECHCSPIIVNVFSEKNNQSNESSNFSNETTDYEHKMIESSNGITVSYSFDTIDIFEDDEFDQEYRCNISGFQNSSDIGKPIIPQRTEFYYIPDGYEPQIKIDHVEYEAIPYRLAPGEGYICDTYDEVTSLQRIPVLPFKGTYPQKFVDMVGVECYRGHKIAEVKICPVQLDYENGQSRVIRKLIFNINFVKSEKTLENSLSMNLLNDSFIPYIAQNKSEVKKLLNDNTFFFNKGISNKGNVKEYLIVTTDSLLQDVKRFADWKRILGFQTTVISEYAWTSTQLIDSIQSFASLHPNLYYILLVGNAQNIPPSKIDTDFWDEREYISDVLYSSLDNDHIPDLKLGRLPYSDKETINVVIDKIISTEMSSPRQDDFYSHGLHASFFEFDIKKNRKKEKRAFILNSERVASLMKNIGKTPHRVYYTTWEADPLLLNNGDSVPEEIRRPNYDWNGNSDDILQEINDGCFYVLHRDHGAIPGWIHPWFQKHHLKNLQNGKNLPVVFSINCLTGKFTDERCFSSEFLRIENGGCSAIICAGGASPSSCNDQLVVGMFSAVYEKYKNGNPNDLFMDMGDLLQMGFHRVRESGFSPWKYEIELYHCLGDPSMKFVINPLITINQVEIDLINTSVVNSDCDNLTISIYNPENNTVENYSSNQVNLHPFIGKRIFICLHGDQYYPVIFECTPDKDVICHNGLFENVTMSIKSRKLSMGQGFLTNDKKNMSIFENCTIRHSGELKINGNYIIKNNVKFISDVN